MWWYKDIKELGIYFDKEPSVGIRYVLPSNTEEEKKSIEKYPFINKKDLEVILFDYKKPTTYRFTIPKGYCWDGASIPKCFWRMIGANSDNRFLIPSMIHDILCENHEYVNYDKNFSSAVFNALLVVSGVKPFKRYLMKHSVNTFQTFCGWNKRKKKGND